MEHYRKHSDRGRSGALTNGESSLSNQLRKSLRFSDALDDRAINNVKDNESEGSGGKAVAVNDAETDNTELKNPDLKSSVRIGNMSSSINPRAEQKYYRHFMYRAFRTRTNRSRRRIFRWWWLVRRTVQRSAYLFYLPLFAGRGLIILWNSLLAYAYHYLRLSHRAEKQSVLAAHLLSDLLEDMQKTFFQAPWLSDFTVVMIEAVGKVASIVLRSGLRAAFYCEIGDKKYLRQKLREVPIDGYQMAMGVWLAVGEAAGYFTGHNGKIVPAMLSGKWVSEEKRKYPLPMLNRRRPPYTLSDTFLDIEDIYWNAATGAPVKIIRVGDNQMRTWRGFVKTVNLIKKRKPRWIVVLAGTDHLGQTSTRNPADSQTNLNEALDHRSIMRQGVHDAIVDAMKQCGIKTSKARSKESVLMIGHSQGAMIAMAMANDPKVDYKIDAIVSAGGPIGRMRVPDDTTILALRHRQDIIPAIGGFYGEFDPRIVVMERSLEMPRSSALYYAHASSTYADTARLAVKLAHNSPNSQIGKAVKHINSFFPVRWTGGDKLKIKEFYEPTRLFIYEVIQDTDTDSPTSKKSINTGVLDTASQKDAHHV